MSIGRKFLTGVLVAILLGLGVAAYLATPDQAELPAAAVAGPIPR